MVLRREETEDEILKQLRWLRRMKWDSRGKPWMAKVVGVSGAVQERKAEKVSVRQAPEAGAEVGEEVRWEGWRPEEEEA